LVLYHASDCEVKFPEIRLSKYTKDFSWGFYCTNNKKQAIRWANRNNGTPVVNYYNYTPNEELSVLKFDYMCDEWLDFIASCRAGNLHKYDIVEGPMADDTIWNYVNDYIYGNITKEQFWALAKFRYPTHQISFHTIAALSCIKFERSEVIYDR
jgi:hypothetical protein